MRGSCKPEMIYSNKSNLTVDKIVAFQVALLSVCLPACGGAVLRASRNRERSRCHRCRGDGGNTEGSGIESFRCHWGVEARPGNKGRTAAKRENCVVTLHAVLAPGTPACTKRKPHRGSKVPHVLLQGRWLTNEARVLVVVVPVRVHSRGRRAENLRL